MMAGAAPAKFRFDLDLGQRDERNTVVTETAMAVLSEQAREDGRREGFAEGERTAMAIAAQSLADAARQLADHAAALNAGMDDARRHVLEEAVGLAAAIGRKLAGQLLATHPLAEIEALIADCLSTLDAVPHLVVRCHPDLADAVRDIANTRIATSGFTGRLVVLGEPERGLDDVRIEWVDGGIERDRSALEAEIDTRIARYLTAARRNALRASSEGSSA